MRIKLHCEDVDTHCAWDPMDAKLFRQQIDRREIELDYMPNVGEQITLFVQRGWVEATVGSRGIAHAFEDAEVKDEYVGKTWYSIWFRKIVIMEHYVDKEE